MKKIINSIILSLIVFLGLSINCFAASASNSITASRTGSGLNYVDGITVYHNESSDYDLYTLDESTYLNSSTRLYNPTEVREGFAYIINNNNLMRTSNEDYYITQVAIWWYQDYINGNNNNLNNTEKNYIINNQNSNSYCRYIYQLFNGAKSASNGSGAIEFNNDDITFTEEGNYYVSNYIYFTTYNLRENPSISFSNAPTSTRAINTSLTADGRNYFQIRIPINNLDDEEEDFNVYVTSTKKTSIVYSYRDSYDGADYILDRTYTSSYNDVQATLRVNLNNYNGYYDGNYNYNNNYNNTTVISIATKDNNNNYISGIEYSLYQGNCLNYTCTNSNYVYTFTSTNAYTNVPKRLSSGYYTLVRENNSNNYNIPEKSLIRINGNSNESFIIYPENNYNNNNYGSNSSTKYNVSVYNNLNDSSNYFKVYDINDNLVTSYVSTKNYFTLNLPVGTYYIIDTNNNFNKVYFEVRNDGKLYVKYQGYDYEEYDKIELCLNYTNNNNKNDNNSNDNNYYNNTYNYNYDNNNNNNDSINDNYYESTEPNIEANNSVVTNTNVEVNGTSVDTVIDVPITSVSSTIKYIIGALILCIGGYLVFKNVKKQKNSI